jgi:ABC-2 type transport system permease protein
MSFWRRNLAAARLAWIQQFEYRFNLFVDAILQPVLTATVEVALWYAMVSGIGDGDSLGGFSRAHYLHYALWAAFVARISANWMYEFRMGEEIQSGTINVILTRPLSFYQFYLSQFMSYKVLTSMLSLTVPAMIASFLIPGPTDLSRLPMACLLILAYLIMAYNISFIVVCGGFHLNRISSITTAKNIAIWCFTGELFPIDLAPPAVKNILLNLPFSAGVYVPVGYITGRCEADLVLRSLLMVLVWAGITGLVGQLLWSFSIKRYSGTGA